MDSTSRIYQAIVFSDEIKQRGSMITKATRKRSTAWYFLVCGLCTIINIYLFNSVGASTVLTYQDLFKMRRPNAYIGLERAPAINPPPPSLVVYPTLMSRINLSSPLTTYGDDPVKFSTWTGLVAPVESTFQTTSVVSTIVQFHTVDYRMEICELLLNTPMMHDFNSFNLGSGVNLVDVWTLATVHRLYKTSLSWNTRPSRIRKVDTFAVTLGMNYTFQFPCPFDSIHTFEFSAGTPETVVEWSQGLRNPSPGLIMRQHYAG